MSSRDDLSHPVPSAAKGSRPAAAGRSIPHAAEVTGPRTIAEAKSQAKALRQALETGGRPVSHGQSLELVARQHGARDWNTLHARLARAEPETFRLGQRVAGRYLGQPMTGRVVSLARAGQGYRLALQLDRPVDTVRSERFSNLRHHVRGTVGSDGRSARKTSDGAPQLVIEGLQD